MIFSRLPAYQSCQTRTGYKGLSNTLRHLEWVYLVGTIIRAGAGRYFILILILAISE